MGECVAVLGVNHGRTSIPSPTETGRGWTCPVCSTVPRAHNSSMLRVNARGEVGCGQDPHDHVLLSAPRVVGPVGRARPDVRGVADDELVVHEVGHSGDPAGRHRERLDGLGLRLGRRRHRDRPRVVDVVDEPDRDAALLRGEERREDEAPASVSNRTS